MADNEVARAVVTIVPTMEGAQQEITKSLTNAASSPAVSQAGNTAGSTFASGLGKGLAVAGAATAAVAAAAVKSADAFMDAAGEVASYGDNIDKMSQKMGFSTDAFQEWDFIAQHSGTSIEAIKGSLLKMDAALEKDSDAWGKLGLSQKDMLNMSEEEKFSKTVTALQGISDETQRAALAQDIFGKKYQELMPLLNTSAEDTAAMKQQVHDLGGVMSEEAVKASAAYQDSLKNLQTGFAGLKNNLMGEFLPSITSVMDGLSAIISGDSDGGLAQIEEGINAFVDNLTEIAPKVFEVGVSIIESLAKAILDNLPTLLEAGLPIIMEVVKAIIDNLPNLIKVGLEMLLTIAKSIGDSLPTLIPTIVDVVLSIVDTLIDNVDMLIDAAIALIVGLANGLIQAAPRLIQRLPEIIQKMVTALIQNAPKLLEASMQLISSLAKGLIQYIPTLIRSIPQIITAIVNGFKSGVSQMVSVGGDIVNGIWTGIKNVWQNLVDNVTSLGQSLVNSVKSFFQIGSPSKLFANEVGQWIPEGIAVGIEANEDDLFDTVDDMMKKTVIAPSIEDISSSMVNMNAGRIAADTSSSDIAAALMQLADREVNVNVSLEGDAQGLFRQVRKQTNQFIKSTGASPFLSPA